MNAEQGREQKQKWKENQRNQVFFLFWKLPELQEWITFLFNSNHKLDRNQGIRSQFPYIGGFERNYH